MYGQYNTLNDRFGSVRRHQFGSGNHNPPATADLISFLLVGFSVSWEAMISSDICDGTFVKSVRNEILEKYQIL